MLVLILGIFAFLAILGASLLYITRVEVGQSGQEQGQLQNHYTARAGADAMAAYLIANPDRAREVAAKTEAAPGTGELGFGLRFSVAVSIVRDGETEDDLPKELIIRSTAWRDELPAETVTLTLLLAPPDGEGSGSGASDPPESTPGGEGGEGDEEGDPARESRYVRGLWGN